MSFLVSRARRLFDYGDLDNEAETGGGNATSNGSATARVVGGAMSVTIEDPTGPGYENIYS